MIYNSKQLANYLKLVRNQNNWSQAEVAKRIGVKQSTLSNFENDPERCQIQTVFKILQALGLTMNIMPKPPHHT
ncbi:MAG: type II toxin-antitoxin system antitoxin HipB, partial [Pseudomonadota bacterium]|nr:type II toxin-antitoxin system antitoxin HipB [Pseudomonadota bacterium]